MVKNNKNKFIKFKEGFSLAEALVSMLVLSMFFLATTKIMTTKQKDIEPISTGFYECFADGSKLHEQYVDGGGVVYENENTPFCTFEPPSRLPSIVINVFYKGSGMQYCYISQPHIDNDIHVTGSKSGLTQWITENILENDESGVECNTIDSSQRKGMKQIYSKAYPQSKFIQKIESNSYYGPVMFIIW